MSRDAACGGRGGREVTQGVLHGMAWHAKERKRGQSQVESLEAGSWLSEPFACPASAGAMVRISNSNANFQLQILMLN